MARLQLALNVDKLDDAIDFYGKLFNAEPNKIRDGYANFAVADPPLKLVLFERPQAKERLNHLGVEVGSADEVVAATERLSSEGLATETQNETSCCYAVQDKVWVDAPEGDRWEIYTVLADDEQLGACCA